MIIFVFSYFRLALAAKQNLGENGTFWHEDHLNRDHTLYLYYRSVWGTKLRIWLCSSPVRHFRKVLPADIVVYPTAGDEYKSSLCKVIPHFIRAWQVATRDLQILCPLCNWPPFGNVFVLLMSSLYSCTPRPFHRSHVSQHISLSAIKVLRASLPVFRLITGFGQVEILIIFSSVIMSS